MTVAETAALRRAFLSSLGLVYLSAFASYYVQFPGLLSSSGLSPVSRVLPHVHPSIDDRLVKAGWVDADSLCELLAFAGVALSSIAASEIVHHGLIFVCLTATYSFLVSIGGTFYSFQWDILLIESGTVTALCCAPWTRRNLRPPVSTDDGGSPPLTADPNPVGAWPIRFLLFKLMFMSGVVKIQADCPTWRNLTALEYHFATQCLPGPLAWHAQQVHPFLLRLSVAAMFVIEIPAAFLLITPAVEARFVGAVLQVLLQVGIILTGNYNFFNVLTAALCLPCMEVDRPRSRGGDQKSPPPPDGKSNALSKRLQQLASWAFLVWSFSKMFWIDLSGDHFHISLRMTRQACNELIDRSLPIAIPSCFCGLLLSAWTAFRHRGAQKRNLVSILIRTMVCTFAIGITSVPMLSLTPRLERNGYVGSEFFSPAWLTARSHRMANGYGLFRRMTGVGEPPRSDSAIRPWGWAGLPPSVVARPEIVLYGMYEGSNNTSDDWKELNFRWKPGDVAQRPKQVAPHQPRLDWQMWFAALGNYQHNPWLIHLLQKMLVGCPPVLELLDEPELKSGERRLSKVRADLFHYDFTRLDTEWNRRIPDVTIVPKRTDVNDVRKPVSSWISHVTTRPHEYWTRTPQREYIPAIEKGNPSVARFLSSHGYDGACVSEERRCSQIGKGSSLLFLCRVAALVRSSRMLFWSPVCIVIILRIIQSIGMARACKPSSCEGIHAQNGSNKKEQ